MEKATYKEFCCHYCPYGSELFTLETYDQTVEFAEEEYHYNTQEKQIARFIQEVRDKSAFEEAWFEYLKMAS